MMKYFTGLILALVLAGPALADKECSSEHRFGNSIVRVGDSERRVIQAAGQPDSRAQLQNGFGAGVGVRLDYYIRHMTVQIYVQGGTVSSVCRIRD
jgi:hypothetical protein